MSLRPYAARLAGVVVALAAAFAVTPGGPPRADAAPAATAVRQTFTVPASGAFTVVGHGFGHGRGMSQYGAQGAALQGLNAKAILAFYYPGTTLTTAAGSLRVLIGADTTSDLVVAAGAGQNVLDLGTGERYPLPTDLGATQWRLTVAGTATVVQYLAGGSWHGWKPGGLTTLVGDGAFRSKARQLTLVLPGGDKRAYRGTLVAASPQSGSADRDTVDVVGLDDYVKGVVPAEMPASWRPAALKSQAVAARTYAVWQRQSPKAGHYDICDASACQVYRGVAGEVAAASSAVDRSAGWVLTYRGAPAFTQFSASSGGWTAAGSQPYLVHQADPYDDHAGNPVHTWQKAVNESTVEKAYPAIGDLRSITVTQREGDGQWSGRALSLTLVGSKGSRTITGDDLRWTLGLRSSWFGFTA